MLKKISQFLYRQSIKDFPKRNTPRFLGKICGKLRLMILGFCDPVIRMKVGNKFLYMNLSHALPRYMATHPYYNTALGRICIFLKERNRHLHLIDVGANIGDNVSLITDKVSGNFLCIEADEKYLPLLLSNTKNIKNVICERAICDEFVHDVSNISLIHVGGTSYVSNNSSGNAVVKTVTIDTLIEKYNEFLMTNIIKIDTDGYDYKVIRGCEKLISQAKPAIFFELSSNHLVSVGENPLSIFDFLFQKGYREAIFYDNVGFPFIKVSIDQIDYISQLIAYADLKNFYFDVLLFHSIYIDDFRQFYEKEREIFSNKINKLDNN